MASPTQNVVRYSALLGGVFYGIMHQRTLQKSHDESEVKRAEHRRQQLVERAREAYVKKKAEEQAGVSGKKGTGLITDPEDPKFDLEKLVNSWAEAEA